MDTFKKFKRLRRLTRFMGLMFAITGGIFLIMGIFLLLDPESTLSCNGVVSNSATCKKQFASFGAIFAVIGLFALFAPKKWIQQYIVWQESMPNPFKRFWK